MAANNTELPFVVCPDILHINTQQLHYACIPAKLSASCSLSFGNEAKDPKLWLFVLLGKPRQHAVAYLMCSLCVARRLVVLLGLLFWEPVKEEKSASSVVISMPKSNTKIKQRSPWLRHDKDFILMKIEETKFSSEYEQTKALLGRNLSLQIHWIRLQAWFNTIWLG